MDFSNQLAWHALAMMFLWVPFVAIQGIADIMSERRHGARRSGRQHWYTPLTHPLRSAHGYRLGAQH